MSREYNPSPLNPLTLCLNHRRSHYHREGQTGGVTIIVDETSDTVADNEPVNVLIIPSGTATILLIFLLGWEWRPMDLMPRRL